MLKQVNIKGYQSLYNLQMELSDITVIVGENDVGKSAFARALSSWALNSSGTECVSRGEKKAVVSVNVDGDLVVWEKGEGVNRYTFGVNVFDKVGRNPPPDIIRDKVKINEVEFSKGDKYNIQIADQFCTPFLLGETNQGLRKLLSIITKSEELSIASLNCQQDIHRVKVELKSEALRKERILDNIQVSEQFKALINVFVRMREVRARLSKNLDLYEQKLKIEEKRQRIKYKLRELEDCILVAENEAGNISILEDRLKKGVEEKEKAEKVLFLQKKITDLNSNLESLYRSLGKDMSDLREKLLSLKICPTCGSEIEEDKIEIMLEGLLENISDK